MKTFQLLIKNEDIRIGMNPGETLLEAIRRVEGLRFETPCNGRGTCGKCKVIVEAGELTPLSDSERKKLTAEEIRDGYRLACVASPAEDTQEIVICIPGTREKAVVLADADYEKSVKQPLFITEEAHFGIAVDIGTTTIAAVLLSLDSGETLARSSMINPQTVIGGDVLSRIAHTMMTEGGLQELQDLVVQGLNQMSRELCEKGGIRPSEIAGFTVAANCTMLHLLLGVDPQSLSRVPFTPVFTEGQLLCASSIGLLPENPKAMLYCLPSVSAYIGADIVAGIYMSGIDKTDKNVMFIDIGTNGEIVLSRKGKMYACSCAAGPAMEGMNISCGMRAAEGAIERVSYEDGSMRIGVIGNTAPIGICGSGVLETVGMLLRTHAINSRGRVSGTDCLIGDRYYENGKNKGYYLTDEPNRLYFNQQDVRQIQLAKGAIFSGFSALIEKSGLTFDDLDEVLIAGQFGSHLKAETLADIGIIPMEDRGKVRYIGNSSLAGAISVFLDTSLMQVYSGLADSVDYMELGSYPDYDMLLMRCMQFPEFN